MYHQIDSPARGLTVTPEDFASQMDLLKEAGYTTVSMDEVLLAMAGEPVPLPPKAVVLTFDDGYDCLYRNAHILKERDFTATMFLTTRLIERSGYLTWEQISTLAAAGYTVGCHTRTHLDLCTLSRANLEKEVQEQGKRLGKKRANGVVFLLPIRAVQQPGDRCCQAAGFMGAVTTEPGVSDLSPTIPYALKRIQVDGRESLKAFAQNWASVDSVSLIGLFWHYGALSEPRFAPV